MTDTTAAADDPERPASKEEVSAMLEELRTMWWQEEVTADVYGPSEITRLESLIGEVPDEERTEIEAALVELRAEQAIEPVLPF